MSKLVRKKAKKSGMPPGTLVHIGEKRTESVRITVIDYSKDSFEQREVKRAEDCFPFKDRPTITWINVDGIHDLSIIGKIGKHFGLHPLIQEDIVNTEQRPKIEDFDDYLYIVLKMLGYNEKTNEISSEQISLVLGQNFVISFQETPGDVFDPIRARIQSKRGRIRECGADYLVYSLMDAIVDSYFLILEKLGEKLEDVEEEVIANPSTETLRVIHTLKREMIFLRKAVWPLRDVIACLERADSPIIKDTRVYLRDLYDHTIQVIDTIEIFRDFLAGLVDIYLSSISNKLNQIMKVLTIIATIFIPLTFVVGLYGMNFKHMPELEWEWGYPLVLLAMTAIGILMLLYFKKNDWI